MKDSLRIFCFYLTRENRSEIDSGDVTKRDRRQLKQIHVGTEQRFTLTYEEQRKLLFKKN